MLLRRTLVFLLISALLYSAAYYRALATIHHYPGNLTLTEKWPIPQTLEQTNLSIKTAKGDRIRAPKAVLHLRLIPLLQGKFDTKHIALKNPTIDLKQPWRKSLPGLITALSKTLDDGEMVTLKIENGTLNALEGQCQKLNLQTRIARNGSTKTRYPTRLSGNWQSKKATKSTPFTLAFLAQRNASDWLLDNLTLNLTLAPISERAKWHIATSVQVDSTLQKWHASHLIANDYNVTLLGNLSFDQRNNQKTGSLTMPTFNAQNYLEGLGLKWTFNGGQAFTSIQGAISAKPHKTTFDWLIDGAHIKGSWPENHWQIDRLKPTQYWPLFIEPQTLLAPSSQILAYLAAWPPLSMQIDQLDIAGLKFKNADVHANAYAQSLTVSIHAQNRDQTPIKAQASLGAKGTSFSASDVHYALATILKTYGIKKPLEGKGKISIKGFFSHIGKLTLKGHLDIAFQTPFSAKGWVASLKLPKAWQKALIKHPSEHLSLDYRITPHAWQLSNVYLSSPEHSIKGSITFDRKHNQLRLQGKCFDHSRKLEKTTFSTKKLPAPSWKTIRQYLSK